MKMTRVWTPLLLLPLAMWGAGCAKYNYQIVQPESARATIGRDDFQRVAAGEVAYRFKTVDNHLVVLAYNETQGEMKLLGDRSYVVTPRKQSVPVPTQSIAPGSYVKLILPPVPPVVRPRSGVGFGFGYSTGRVYPGEHPHGYPYDPWWGEPDYLYVVGDPTTYWEWEGETEATLHLVFEAGGRAIEQTFVIRRVKV